MEIKISIDWKNRLIRISRYLIVIASVICIYLAFDYIPSEYHNYRIWIGGLQITIIVFTILSEEYYDSIVDSLDDRLNALKREK